MNAPDPLAALQPLREPDAIGWWPPAPGWWLLALLGALLLGALCALLLRRRRAGAYRRRALARLDAIRSRSAEHGDAVVFATEINALLKRIAIDAYGDQVAATSGETWEAFLHDSAPEGPRFTAGFTQAIYRNDAQALEEAPLYRAARHWLARHRVDT
ncbi:MAG: DUF4381 domain-containing protein [Halioglobus sp.]